jgi:hypothetical protein
LESGLIEVMIQKMQMIQCGSSVNLLQMWLMKAIYTNKNRMNQEFQHCLESGLIEVMNMKM